MDNHIDTIFDNLIGVPKGYSGTSTGNCHVKYRYLECNMCDTGYMMFTGKCDVCSFTDYFETVFPIVEYHVQRQQRGNSTINMPKNINSNSNEKLNEALQRAAHNSDTFGGNVED